MKRMHYQHVKTRPISDRKRTIRGSAMRVARSHWGAGRRRGRDIIGWLVAMSLVLVALVGPPLTGQSIPTLIEMRHNILTIDQEFDRWSTRANPFLNGPSTLARP